MSKLGLCPLCGSIMLDKSCCGCDGTGKEKKQGAKPKTEKKKK